MSSLGPDEFGGPELWVRWTWATPCGKGRPLRLATGLEVREPGRAQSMGLRSVFESYHDVFRYFLPSAYLQL